MESPDDGTADTSFFIRDTAFSTASVASVAHQIPMYWATPSSGMLYILALLQSRFIDIIPIVHQPSLGSVGAGLTATIHQCFISDRFGLVFKELATAAQFVKELSFVSARAIRLHPFMTTLQGVCWVTTEDEEEPWFTRPVLVFEKAAYSLWSFMHEEVGRNLIDAQRFSLCIQLATALVDLEQLRIVHGDVKPKNILVVLEGDDNPSVTIQLADFGHSTAVPIEHPQTLVYLPESRPWSIPPNEYHHNGHSYTDASKAMTYSFGVCCIWLLFYNRGRTPCCDFSEDIRDTGGLDSKSMFKLTKKTLGCCASSLQECSEKLKLLWDCCVSPDPEARSASVSPALHILKECLNICQGTGVCLEKLIVEKPPLNEAQLAFQKMPDHLWYYDVFRSMLQISEVDYRVREMILIYLLRRHTETKDDPLWTELNNYLALEIAKCYWLGFGAKRDEKLAGEWLKKTSLRNDWDWHITGITTARNSGYLPCMKITSHILIGHIQLTNDMQCYRDQKLADTILTVERRELEDWTVALGQTHFLVNQRVFNLFEKLNSLGLRNQALNLIERHYDRIKTASPEFDNMSFQRITTALAKAHISIRDHVRARELLLSVYPSWKTSSMRNNAVNNMSDEEFLARSSDYVLLAAIEDEASNYQEAIRMYKTALPRMQQLLGAQNLQCLRTQYNLALCYNNEGKNQESLAVIDAAYELVVGTYGEAHEMSVLIGEKLNELRTNLRIYRAPLIGPWLSRNFEFRFKFDNDSVRASIESSQATLGNNHPYTLVCINRGIKALMGDTRYDEAIKLAECALQIVEDRSGADSDDAGFQRKRLKLCRQTAALHWAFFRWGSWDVGPYKLKRYRGFVVGWERKVFEPFELDLSKDPNYKSMNTVSSPTST